MKKHFITSAAAILAGAGLLFASLPAHALTLSSPRDCDSNAIIRCGALSTSELKQKYSSSGIEPIYARMGITGQEIANTGQNSYGESTYSGHVTKSGDVYIDQGDSANASGLVATGAVTAGRQNMPGSTYQTSGGLSFYERPPSVSFVQSSLPAFVVMEKGRFSFAIIASCGNPVKAAPTTPQPAPPASPPPASTKPAPPKTQPPTSPPTQPQQPNITITNSNTNINNNEQSQAQLSSVPQTPALVTTASAQAQTTHTSAQAQTQPAVQSAAPTPQPSPQPQKSSSAPLPNTGPGNVLGIAGALSLLGGLGHYFYQTKLRRRFY